MRRVTVNREEPEATAISEACKALRDGEVVAFPTDTLYGLAIDPSNFNARARLAEVKGRPESKPPPFIITDMDMLPQIAQMPLTNSASRVCQGFWPGSVTIVVPGAPLWDWKASDGTVGVRLPNSECARMLSKEMGSPLPATSANLTGEPASLSADDVMRELADRGIDLLLDGGVLPTSRGSTVVKFEADGNWSVLREGDVPVASLENSIGVKHG